MTENPSNMVRLTADIAAAYLRNNRAQLGELSDLIRTIFGTMAGLGSSPTVEAQRSPAVSIKKSLADDALTCLCCGRKFSMLKRHLRADHDMSVDDYRTRWKLSRDYPMTAPNYAAQRSKLAKKIGLGRPRGSKKKK